MTGRVLKPDVLMLAALAATLKGDYIREGMVDPWVDSPFQWIKTLRSRQIGKVGEQLVSGWCAAKGLDVIRSSDSEADRVIAGRRVEIKFSTLLLQRDILEAATDAPSTDAKFGRCHRQPSVSEMQA